MSIKVNIISLGCSKNLVDSECMISILKENDFELVSDITTADIAIINSCGFIDSAKKEAIDTILEVSDYKKPQGNLSYIVVAGCLPQRYADDILQLLPEVDIVLGTAHYKDIAVACKSLFDSDDYSKKYVSAPGGIEHLRTSRFLTTNTYAYLKIGEGCFNKCAYCAIPIIRGDFVSRSLEDIMAEARDIASRGIKEIILAAQDTTNYGIDIGGKSLLTSLLRMLSTIDGIETIRIMYGYINGIDDDLISEIRDNPKVAHYLDIPIQHADDRILKLMNRRDTVEQIDRVITKLRKEIPDVILRTTVMVGFPGEDDIAFDNLISNIRRWKFDRLGCFAFSSEEGTKAYDMIDNTSDSVKKKRVETIYEVQREITSELNRERINQEVKVTIDSISNDGIFYRGRSYGEAPDVDPEIYVISQHGDLIIGNSYLVRIVDSSDYELTGVTI